MKITKTIAGIMATFIKVFDPATASGFDAPLATAALLKLSYHLPIIGMTRDVENIPAPPIKDNPSAPVLGRYSETKPSIVGQKKQMPAAKTNAAPKAADPLALLSKSRPMHARKEDKINIPFGFNRCTNGPANDLRWP